MQRAIFVALGVGAVVTSAAALGLASSATPEVTPLGTSLEATVASSRSAARLAQRAGIQARYEARRARCDSLGGAEHDRCLIEAHAVRGLALLEAAAPYQQR